MTSEAPSVTAATPSLSAPALRAGRSRTAGSSRVRSVISQVLLSLVALLFLVPIIWMVLSALKPSAEVFTVTVAAAESALVGLPATSLIVAATVWTPGARFSAV